MLEVKEDVPFEQSQKKNKEKKLFSDVFFLSSKNNKRSFITNYSYCWNKKKRQRWKKGRIAVETKEDESIERIKE